MPQFDHDVLFLPQIDDKNRTVIVTDQPGPGPVEDIAKKYERDLPKSLKDCEIISSEIVTLANDRNVAKLVHTNSQPGVPVRQINYIIGINDRYFFVAYTGMEADGVVFDELVEKFVATIGPCELDMKAAELSDARERE